MKPKNSPAPPAPPAQTTYPSQSIPPMLFPIPPPQLPTLWLPPAASLKSPLQSYYVKQSTPQLSTPPPTTPPNAFPTPASAASNALAASCCVAEISTSVVLREAIDTPIVNATP